MKYNTFWGHVFWVLLTVSFLADLRPILMNLWNLVYNGSIDGSNLFFWLCGMAFLSGIAGMKISLLYQLFPRADNRIFYSFGTNTLCGLCGGICTLYAFCLLVIIICLGGLKVFDVSQVIQMVISLLTPFIFIYYLVREEER